MIAVDLSIVEIVIVLAAVIAVQRRLCDTYITILSRRINVPLQLLTKNKQVISLQIAKGELFT